MPLRLGEPEFNVIDINTTDVASALLAYVQRGSKLTGVSIDDIDVRVLREPTSSEKGTIAGMLKIGMKLFDAIVWLTLPSDQVKPLVVSQDMKEQDIVNPLEVARSVFYCYFFLITQARYPASRVDQTPPKVPNFLRVIMGMDKDQHYYVDQICTFNPTKFDPKWATKVSFAGFGQEALTRFGLGVAGYRLFGPFKTYNPRVGLDPAYLNAYNFARNVATAPASWRVHPLTRSPDVLTERGNLNKNLSNLILECFTDEQIDEMVASKMLYARPTVTPNMDNWKTWIAADTISGDDRIFPEGR